MDVVDSHRNAARLLGLLFLLAFVSYGVGAALTNTATNATGYPGSLASNSTALASGAILMATIHSLVIVTLASVFQLFLRPHSPVLGTAFLGMAICATTVLMVGALLLLMQANLGAGYQSADPQAAGQVEMLRDLLQAGNNIAYIFGMTLWSFGGLFFCTVLLKSRILPRFMPIWGIIGYVILLAGVNFQQFAPNSTIEIITVIPGGLFEVTLSLWLIFKGFHQPKSAATSQ